MSAILFDLDGTLFRMEAHFHAVHGCELDGTRERKAELLAHLIAQHALQPRRTAMIGARDVDMAAALGQGLRAVGALWGYGSREELEAAGAQVLCARPSGLPVLFR